MTRPDSDRPHRDALPNASPTTPPPEDQIPTATAPRAIGYSTAATEYAQAAGQRIEDSVLTGDRSRRSRLVVVAGVAAGVLGNVAVALSQVLPSNPETAIALGILAVVILGAGGLACRGVGELRESPGWKASGCFLCAAAYVATATVALANGVPLIFQS